jgi:hypothetical protein
LKCTREYRPERRRDRVLSPLPGTDIIPLALYFSVSAEVDDAKLKSFFAAIDGKDVAELIKEGQAKLAPSPPVAVAAAAAAAAVAVAVAVPPRPRPSPRRRRKRR